MNTHDPSAATWRKSSYSGANGGNCIEVAAMWRKSSYSGDNGGDCIEVAPGIPGVVPVRDSKDPHGPALTFPDEAWTAFVAGVKLGDFPALD
ncbi:DUF397 domain-containing protein [Wenjunlia tyrosinilytica]|uniref:DUF397 domain-containing protein n=1 Tax=Wenjunlia tyrosinilytica TaxID=1544741 RepID=UPI001E50056E|nr:DUF397 domain-containing protein [Wenjunlia tyrosinilytica]